MKPQQPDQFSPEYIAYILSDEAKGLQERWQPKAGDWYKDRHYDDPCLVVGDAASVELERAHGRARWFPSLYDLLQIIEGAGWDVSSEWSWETGGRRYRYVAMRPKPYRYVESDWETSRMLAAAKLAVRALEGNKA